MLLNNHFLGVGRFSRYFSNHSASSLPESRSHGQNVLNNSLIIKHSRCFVVPVSVSKSSHTISRSVTMQEKEMGPPVISIILTSGMQSLCKQWYLLYQSPFNIWFICNCISCARISRSIPNATAMLNKSSFLPFPFTVFSRLLTQVMYIFAIVSQLSKMLLFDVVFDVCSLKARFPTLHQLLTFYSMR
jgi:hypothetical protein